jgi:hypothetical protein
LWTWEAVLLTSLQWSYLCSAARYIIDELRSFGLSFMPEGLEKELDQQAMADLMKYLANVKDSPEIGQQKVVN